MASRYPNLHPSASLLDLQNGSTWDEAPRPSSSSSTSTSSTSRSATPTLTSWPPTSANPSSNPWLAMNAANAKRATPPSSPDSHTPQYQSRSTTPTPVAPQPMRPVTMNVTMSPNAHAATPTADAMARGLDYPVNTPNLYRQNGAQVSPRSRLHSIAKSLERMQITFDVAKKFHHNYPQLLVTAEGSKDGKTHAYHWAIKNPMLAILFVLCEDIDALPKACFYDLSDTQFPLSIEDLMGIATNPRKVVEQQWRVMVKDLPKEGQHINFAKAEVPPLQRVSLLAKNPDHHKIVDTVSWLGELDGRVYVRKTFVCKRSSQQAAVVSQMHEFKKLNHPNVARIICSYTLASSEGLVAAFISSQAQCNLNEYLRRISDGPLDSTRIRMHFGWINDLMQAVAYVHRQGDKPAHRRIRPDKILVDGSRIYLSVFGIDPDLDTTEPETNGVVSPPQTPTFAFPSTYDMSYIFAAPETLRKHNLTRAGERLADVFSLGCVFLCMFTAGVRGWSLSEFASYRAASSMDSSFHANIGRVLSWHQKLYPANTSSASLVPSHRRQDTFGEMQLLNLIKYMIAETPSQRQKIRMLAPAFARWYDDRQLVKRRSFDDLDAGMERNALSGRMMNLQMSGPVPCSFDLDIPPAPTPPPSNYYPPFWQRSMLG